MESVKCLEVRQDGYAYFEVGDNVVLVDPTGTVIDGSVAIPRDVFRDTARAFVGATTAHYLKWYKHSLAIENLWNGDLVQSLSEKGIDIETFTRVTGRKISLSLRIMDGMTEYRIFGGETVVLTAFAFGDTMYYIGWSSSGVAYWWIT